MTASDLSPLVGKSWAAKLYTEYSDDFKRSRWK